MTMRLRVCALGLAGLLAAGAVAMAKVCPDCQMRVTLPACGQCQNCAGQTSTINHKICGDCSEKLQQCQMCRRSMAATRPTTQPDDREELPRVRPLP